jgi:hypothetical protein
MQQWLDMNVTVLWALTWNIFCCSSCKCGKDRLLFNTSWQCLQGCTGNANLSSLLVTSYAKKQPVVWSPRLHGNYHTLKKWLMSSVEPCGAASLTSLTPAVTQAWTPTPKALTTLTQNSAGLCHMFETR